MEKVIATEKAIEVIEQLKSKHGNILFEQSYGCCDGTAPMCYEADGHYLRSSLINLGEIGGVPYYIDKKQAEYSKHTQTVIDVTDGMGAAFSLEGALGVGFVIQSRPFPQQ